jgi:hypothetical protein
MISRYVNFIFVNLIFLSFNAQNWLPINSQTKSVFVLDTYPSPLVSFCFDSITSVGTDTIFYNYQTYSDNYNSTLSDYPDCEGWGSVCSTVGDSMSVFGSVINNEGSQYDFISYAQDTLSFNLEIDSNIIYQGLNEVFWQLKIKDTTASIFGVQDSVRLFMLYHRDLNNNPVLGGYDSVEIRLSKNHGLLNFINVKDFLQRNEVYHIYGLDNGLEQLGNWCIKYYEIFQNEVGNVFQLNTSYSYMTDDYLQTSTVIDEGFLGGFYNVDYLEGGGYGININYIMSSIPFKKFAPHQDGINFNIYLDSTYCYGKGYYGSTQVKNNFYYCSESDCYSSLDQDCIIEYTDSFLPGIGMFEEGYDQTPGAISCSGSRFTSVQYSNYSGNICGQQLYASISEDSKIEISIYPNPIINEINIKGLENGEILEAKIYDLSGKNICSVSTRSNTIETNNLSSGYYFLTLKNEDGIIFKGKFIKE